MGFGRDTSAEQVEAIGNKVLAKMRTWQAQQQQAASTSTTTQLFRAFAPWVLTSVMHIICPSEGDRRIWLTKLRRLLEKDIVSRGAWLVGRHPQVSG